MLSVWSRPIIRLVGVLCLINWLAGGAAAGGGPENVFLVANARSWASLAIAHHYAALRQIPPNNVLYLDWPYSTDRVDIGIFREKLLAPIVGAMNARGIITQIDYVAYASDFPWSIDFTDDLKQQKVPPEFTPIASVTALTYFATQAIRNQFNFLNYVNAQSNRYMPKSNPKKLDVPSRGFHGWYGFGADSQLVEGGGESYLLSTMLGVTSNGGMSVDEVVEYLTRSVAADGTRPKGTIYYCKSPDQVRSGPREPGYDAACVELRKLGVRAEVIAARIPAGKHDVAGLLTGTRNFDWPASQSKILPGAICESLTSLGGVFSFNDGQQRLTDFLRYGAAGSTGTVIEPFAIAAKFPSPYMHVHYARGCSLAEAVYQSVSAPYQLLVMGDPLCQPWAEIPTVTVQGVRAGTAVKGRLTLRPDGKSGDEALDRFELFVEGAQVARCAVNDTMELDTTALPDGYVELRIVGFAPGPIETQGRAIIPVRVNNQDRKIDFTCSARSTATWKQPFKLTANAPGANKIIFSEGMRVLGTISGAEAEIEVKPEELGLGPVTLRARGQFGEETNDAVLSAPIQLTIEPDAPLPAQNLRQGMKLVPGLQFLADGEKRAVDIKATDESKWLVDTNVKKDQKFMLAAIFEVPKDGLYQFQVKHVGPLSIRVDKATLYDKKQIDAMWQYVPVGLAAGLHHFQLSGVGGQPTGLEIRFGDSSVMNLDGKQFRHPPPKK